MSYSTPYEFTALELVTAALMNGIQENITALWPYTTAGDFAYATSASALSRLAKPGSASKYALVNTSVGTPSYAAIPIAGVAARTTAFSHTGDANWTDITNLTTTLTLPTGTTYSVLGDVAGACAQDNASGGGPTSYFRMNIGGTAQTAGTEPTLSDNNANFPLSIVWLRTGIAAGSCIVKAQLQLTADLSETVYARGILRAFAFAE